MNFQQLVDGVVTETNRPDMDSSQGGDGQIQQRVASATLYLHSMDYFYKDIIPTNVIFDQKAFIQQLNTDMFPRYRSIAWCRKNDPTLATYQQNPTLLPPIKNDPFSNYPVTISEIMAFFTVIRPDKIFDGAISGAASPYNTEALNVIYQAGDTIYFKSRTAFNNILFGYYAFPNVDTTNNGQNFSSWIARDMPYAIITMAASTIFAATGKQEASRKYDAPDGVVTRWVNNILLSNIEAEGR